jgi:hypothetical protein
MDQKLLVYASMKFFSYEELVKIYEGFNVIRADVLRRKYELL